MPGVSAGRIARRKVEGREEDAKSAGIKKAMRGMLDLNRLCGL